jgi:MFS family permease
MLSGFGLSSAGIAFPLLVLATTGSAAESGVVLGTIAATQIAAGLPAGVLADRWNRKYIMVACEAMLAAAAASLVVALIEHALTIPHMIVVAGVIGVCGGLFEPAESASLPNLVQDRQVSTALAMNFARSSLGGLTGTAAGGFLFAVGRAVPFVADMASHAAACSALMFLRIPSPPARPQPAGNLRREMLDGLRWVWQQRLIRVLAICALVLNLFFTAFYLVIIVLARRRGIPSGEIGVMAAMLGAGGVVGSLLAPYLDRLGVLGSHGACPHGHLHPQRLPDGRAILRHRAAAADSEHHDPDPAAPDHARPPAWQAQRRDRADRRGRRRRRPDTRRRPDRSAAQHPGGAGLRRRHRRHHARGHSKSHAAPLSPARERR